MKEIVVVIMVEVKASEAFINLLEDFSKEENLTLEEQETVDHDIAAKHVSLRSIRCLHKYRPNVKLHEAIKGSNISIPYAEKIKISEEKKAADERMKARRGYLQVQQETRDYNRMVYGTTRLPTDNEETISSAIKSVKYQMAISSNMLAAVSLRLIMMPIPSLHRLIFNTENKFRWLVFLELVTIQRRNFCFTTKIRFVDETIKRNVLLISLITCVNVVSSCWASWCHINLVHRNGIVHYSSLQNGKNTN